MQGADGRPRVGTRADDEHAGGLPRPQVSCRHVQADGDDRASRPRQSGLGGDAARGGRRPLSGTSQVAAQGPILPGSARGSAHLPGDLALADDHGLQPGCRREKIDEAVVAPQVTQLHVLARGVRGLGEFALHRVLECVGVGLGRGVDVDGDAVTRAQDHDSAHLRQRAHERGAEVGRAGESGDIVKGGVTVVRGKHMNSHNASI